MASTIHDVAKLSNVHASTVSRVLNGKTTISEATKEKVYAAMRELNYHPNSIARSLASGSAGMIGLVLDVGEECAYHNEFFSSSQYAIEKVAQAHGCHVLIINGGTPGANAAENLLLEHKVDGLILPPSAVNLSLIKQIDPVKYTLLGQPDNDIQGASWVDIDNELGASMAVEHLVNQGCERIAYIGGELNEDGMGFIARRLRGYRQALPASSRPLVIAADGTPEDACRAASACMDGGYIPDAFLCDDNVTAYGLLQAVKAHGLNVPRDVAVITFNDYPLARYMDPPLTAVNIDTEKLGEKTAELLFEQIEREGSAKQVLLPPTLITRGSTDKR